jgi:hypothetical protein
VTSTPTQRLAEILLRQPVTEYVAAKRAEGRSWRLIARDLYEDTAGEIDVTYETLRGWATSDAESAA